MIADNCTRRIDVQRIAKNHSIRFVEVFEKINLQFDSVGKQNIVSSKVNNVFSLREPEALIERAAISLWSFMFQEGDGRFFANDTFNNGNGIIGTSIINDNDFNIRISLIQNGMNCFGNESFMIVTQTNDRNKGFADHREIDL